jgi:hypothetical protein
MIILGVPLPEITPEWLATKYVASHVIPHDNMDAFIQSLPPEEPRYRGPGCNINFDLGREAYQTTTHRISGRMIYPPGGYMDWHTNGDWQGQRMYAAWSEDGNSGMLWFKDGKTVVDYDKPGWNIRTFKCPEWHAVFSKCWRVSIGWHLEEKPHVVEDLVHPA